MRNALSLTFVAGLPYLFRDLLPALAEHVDDNRGEILPHLLLTSFCREVCRQSLTNEWIDRFFSYIEFEFKKDNSEICDIIAVSFIEAMPFEVGATHWTFDKLGPKMKAEYRKIYGF